VSQLDQVFSTSFASLPKSIAISRNWSNGFEVFDDFLGKNLRMIFLTPQTSNDLNGLNAWNGLNSGFLAAR
jgi:hypothetical protein